MTDNSIMRCTCTPRQVLRPSFFSSFSRASTAHSWHVLARVESGEHVQDLMALTLHGRRVCLAINAAASACEPASSHSARMRSLLAESGGREVFMAETISGVYRTRCPDQLRAGSRGLRVRWRVLYRLFGFSLGVGIRQRIENMSTVCYALRIGRPRHKRLTVIAAKLDQRRTSVGRGSTIQSHKH